MTFKAPDSLAEQIAHHLAERIIRGELKPGERIQEQKVTLALNVSRGGLRAIVEDKVILGQKFEIEVGTDEPNRRSGRIVWVQEEPDGAIVGIEFSGAAAAHHSVPPAPPGSQRIPSFPVAAAADEDEE